MTELRILTMDPGTSNFAVSIMRVRWDQGKFQFKCEGTAMLDKARLLKDMKTMRASLKQFEEYVRPLFEGQYDIFVAERFQARGGKGPTIESVNCMLGRMAGMSEHIETADFITAGVWKNEFNRHADLKEMYLDLAELRKENRANKLPVPIAIHQLDSMLLGIYAACKKLGIKPFHFVNTRAKEEKLLRRLAMAPALTCLAPALKVPRRTSRRKSKSVRKRSTLS